MLKLTDEEKQRTANSTFPIGGVSCSADSLVQIIKNDAANIWFYSS